MLALLRRPLGRLADLAKTALLALVPEDLHDCWQETADEFDDHQRRDWGKP